MDEVTANQTRCCGPDSCGKANSIASNDTYCVGSLCMAWRWLAPVAPATEPTEGYCGLAGKP